MPSHPEYHLDDERRGNQDRAGLIALLGLVRDRLSEGDENHADPARNQQAGGNAGQEKYPPAAGYFALARQPRVENADDQQGLDALAPYDERHITELRAQPNLRLLFGHENRRRRIEVEIVEEFVLSWIERPDDESRPRSRCQHLFLAQFPAFEFSGRLTKVVKFEFEATFGGHLQTERCHDAILELDPKNRVLFGASMGGGSKNRRRCPQ